jgi:hypothetical protein|nr:MAG TPA: Fic family protein [Caudoviricetes sp.]
MNTPKLLNIFHQNEDEWRKLYRSLFYSPLACHLNIFIKQYQSSKDFPAFYYYTENIATLLSNIIDAQSQLMILITEIPGVAINHFSLNCLIDEIKATNDIEGVRSTKKEIKIAIDQQSNINSQDTVRLWGIVNKYMKLKNQNEISFSSSKELREFYNDFTLKEVCRDDPRNAPDGKFFRKNDVHIISDKGKTIHKGIFPEEKIIRYIDVALNILQNPNIPILIRISIFHYLFGYIHPFYDGNGRTSRFITSYYLSKALHPLIAMRLSLTIKRGIKTYYKLFENTNAYGNCGDLTPFISGFLWFILKSIQNVINELNKRMHDLNYLSEQISSLNIPDKTDRRIYYILLQASLFSFEGATIEEISDAINLSIRTIRHRIDKFPKNHIDINKSHKAYRYRLTENILLQLNKQ